MTREEAKEEAIAQLERISRNLTSIGETVDYTEFAIEAIEQEPCEDAVSRAEVIRLAEQGQVQGFEWQIRKLVTLPSVTLTKSKCEKLADDINPAEYSFTHYARLTPEEAEHDLFRLDRETGEYIPLTDNTNYALPETSERFKDIKQAVIQGCANMMKAVGEQL